MVVVIRERVRLEANFEIYVAIYAEARRYVTLLWRGGNANQADEDFPYEAAPEHNRKPVGEPVTASYIPYDP